MAAVVFGDGEGAIQTITSANLNPNRSTPDMDSALSLAQQRFEGAVAHHRAGRLSEAATLYRQILQENAHHVDALGMLGILAHQQGDNAMAVECLGKAVALRPDWIEAHYNLGNVCKALQRADQAVASYRKVLELGADMPDACFFAGNGLKELGYLEEAVTCYRRAVQVKPDFTDALATLGLTLLELDRVREAVDSLERLLVIAPHHGEALANLGVAYQELRRFDEAIDHYARALRVKPETPEIVSNMGLAFQELGRLDEAEQCFQKGLRIKPDDPTGLNNLGNLYKQQGNFDEAYRVYRQALQLAPNSPEVTTNLGAMLFDQGLLEPAGAAFHQALGLQPDYPEAHLGLGLLHLLQGDFEVGWRYFEWRWKTRNFIHNQYPQPLWHGGRLEGGTILLHCEQGFGDGIQFIRYVPLVKERTGARVVVVCPEPLKRLFATVAGGDAWVTSPGAVFGCDCQAPLMSLPYLMGTTVATIPATIPYLAAEAGAVAVFRERLQSWPGLKVGIAWRGDPRHKNDRNRSMDPSWLTPLCAMAGVRLVNLQKDATAAELALFAGKGDVIDMAGLLDDFSATAALISNLDGVIAVDTAVIHLSGALGVPTWVLLPHVADWRWMLRRTDSPWYPRMRLVRQAVAGEWQGCVAAVMADLRDRVGVVDGGDRS
ncbi:MAG: tetratricopeptide repeat protein [Magnetococcales bacterium]|nr:tetratricopeptide repeat protein [Magnetococcales bacterium]